MKKRIVSALLIFILVIGALPGVAFAADGLSNFSKTAVYQSGRFSDVKASDWYAPYVQASFEYGLINGKSAGRFDPDDDMTLAEAIKLSATLHSTYHNGVCTFPKADPWYGPYVEYALQNGIITTDYSDYNAAVTRAEFAVIMSRALPAEALSVKNMVEDNAIPDVPTEYSYSGAVYTLYRAGVLTGTTASGTFMPNNFIKRSEVAAVVTRMANAAYRMSLTMQLRLTKEQIFANCAPAVFYVVIYDKMGTMIKTGSGFFIDSSGLAVTNYHVIDGATSAVITTPDGSEYPVTGVYDYDENVDMALIQVEGSDFPYLKLGDSDAIETGADVYAIGSPLGYQNTISDGIISSSYRDVEGMHFMQITAAISSGSSGGALIDDTGKVIGVTTATAVNAQNINFAVPINEITSFSTEKLVTLASILPDITYYNNRYPAPDFGAYANVRLFKADSDDLATEAFYYRASDLTVPIEAAFEGYISLLEKNTFSFYGYAIEDGRIISYYLNSAYGMLVTFGEVNLDGTPCIRIQIMDL